MNAGTARRSQGVGCTRYDRFAYTFRVGSRVRSTGEGARAVGYLRVSTDEQADSGAGLAAQRAAIEAEAARRGWMLIEVEVDAGASGKSMAGRPALARALGAVSSGAADVLLVAKLDRLSRSLLDFASLMARSQAEGWALVALDLGVDTSTPAGEFMASVMASAAQWERRIIGQRTRDALAAKQAQGVRLGRPPAIPAAVVQDMRRYRSGGASIRAIAQRLTADGVPTVSGGSVWSPSTVQRVLASARPAPPSTRPDGSLQPAT
jgi:DNA invertase Pin-like site-specific DNA recombinase